ncbi:MAG: hypothetical protein NZ571_14905, partial [Anaerolineae bacterium]|nr:hypothetical protein [Anaerolineae bacterium]
MRKVGVFVWVLLGVAGVFLSFFWLPFEATAPLVAQESTPTPAPIISVENAKQVVELRRIGRGTLSDVAFSPDGKTLAVASSIGIWLYDSQDLSREPRLLEEQKLFVDSVAWSPDGQRLASGGMDSTIRVWDVQSGKVLQTLKGHTGGVRTVAWSPDGSMLASGSYDNTVR